MLTILEGPDCSGKSTLARRLQRRCRDTCSIIHQGPYREDVITETLSSVMTGNPYHTIADRLHLGERVYGPVFRGHDLLGNARHRIVARILMSAFNPVQVICLPPWETVSGHWFARKDREMLADLEQLESVYEGFVNVVRYIPTVEYDWTTKNTWELNTELQSIRTPDNQGPGAGWWEEDESILIVGDRADATKPGSLLPFCSDNINDLYVSDQMGDTEEKGLYWANSYRSDGVPADPSFIDQLKPKGIVAIGASASSWLRSSGFSTHTRLDNPRFHRNFVGHEPYPIAEVIHAIRS